MRRTRETEAGAVVFPGSERQLEELYEQVPATVPAPPARVLGGRIRVFWVIALRTAPSPLYGLYRARDPFSRFTVTVEFAGYAVGAIVALLLVGPDGVARSVGRPGSLERDYADNEWRCHGSVLSRVLDRPLGEKRDRGLGESQPRLCNQSGCMSPRRSVPAAIAFR